MDNFNYDNFNMETIRLKDFINDCEISNHILNNLKKYKNLKYFDCSDCNLIKLPELPHKLEILICNFNKLTKLPELPNTLQILNCYYNELTELPDLPSSLYILFCWDNKLNHINSNIYSIKEHQNKSRILKRLKLLDRTLLLEHSARICLNPKRIKRLLESGEINFFDGSFDKLL
jgi:hypothetical protein